MGGAPLQQLVIPGANQLWYTSAGQQDKEIGCHAMQCACQLFLRFAVMRNNCSCKQAVCLARLYRLLFTFLTIWLPEQHPLTPHTASRAKQSILCGLLLHGCRRYYDDPASQYLKGNCTCTANGDGETHASYFPAISDIDALDVRFCAKWKCEETRFTQVARTDPL